MQISRVVVSLLFPRARETWSSARRLAREPVWIALAVLATGCIVAPDAKDDEGAGAGAGSGAGSGAGDGDGALVGDGDGPGGDGEAIIVGEVGDGDGGVVEQLPEGVEPTDLLPARIRRLTNAEYDAAVQSLLGTSEAFGVDFPPDTRQHGFTVNQAQRVDPILVRALDTAAKALAEEARPNFPTLAPCADPAGGGRECAASFVDVFAKEAYRRPLKDEDRTALLGLYDAATTGDGADPDGTPESIYHDGIALVIRGVLQSPGFLYVTETGGVAPEGDVVLTQYEIAAALSFLLTGGPPDEQLLTAADEGTLTDPATREAQARRLIATPAGHDRGVEVISQWLGIDRIGVTDKDSNVYPDFAGVKDQIGQETADFIRGVLDYDGGTAGILLSGESAVAQPGLASVYAASGPARNGLLNQAAFLSVYAHAHESAPILRGTAVLRRVACIEIELPLNLQIDIVPPPPDPTATTRERFAEHSANPDCVTCHQYIDPIGFVFEQFDGMGAHRTTDNGKPVDSTGTVSVGKDFDGSYASSTEFTTALAASADVAECFARQIYRAHAAEAQGIDESEQFFVDEVAGADGAVSFVEALVAYVTSNPFIFRRNDQ